VELFFFRNIPTQVGLSLENGPLSLFTLTISDLPPFLLFNACKLNQRHMRLLVSNSCDFELFPAVPSRGSPRCVTYRLPPAFQTLLPWVILSSAQAVVGYQKDAKPLLKKRCVSCNALSKG
jgi:hypothetical protein